MPHAPTAALRRRHEGVRARLAELSLDALVVTSLPNILYLTNFSGSSAIVVVTREGLHFITDFRYVAAVAGNARTRGRVSRQRTRHGRWRLRHDARSMLQSMHGARVGFEAAHLSVARHAWLTSAVATAATAPTLVPTEGLVEAVRVAKDTYELSLLREAGRRLSQVATEVHATSEGAARKWKSRWTSTGGFDGRGSRSRRLIRLWRRTERRAAARAPGRAKIRPKTTSSCWTSAASTTHTAST